MLTLEASTNTHIAKGNVVVTEKFDNMSTMKMFVPEGQMIVEHGHHNVVATEPESRFVIKITQQEFNPVLRAFQNSFD